VFAVDWVESGEAGNGSLTQYVDPQSIRRDGNKVRLWLLRDYKSVQVAGNKTHLSAVDRKEYDCFEDTVRTMDIYEYSGKMGKGDIVLSIPNVTNPAASVIPGSIAATNLKIACATK
jgi:hypothetical protein